MLGIVLLLLGLALTWGQDVAAPWVNQGEAQMGSTVSFTAGGGDYRVVTSGASRPSIDQTGCTIVTSRERKLRVLGGKDVNASERLGVSRVLGFEAPLGRTRVTCANRFSGSSTLGRFQVVSADGPVSVAVIGAFVLGALLVVAGILLIVRASRGTVRA